jgi:hypothetical protein
MITRLDQQGAHHTSPGNFDLKREPRDYAELKRSMPVFCVSSRAYQSLVNGEPMNGFSKINSTEIPQVRAHAKKLTETARVTNAKSFLNDLAQMLNSLYLWSSKQNIEIYITDKEKKTEIEFVREKLNELEKVRYNLFVKSGNQADGNSVSGRPMKIFPGSLMTS